MFRALPTLEASWFVGRRRAGRQALGVSLRPHGDGRVHALLRDRSDRTVRPEDVRRAIPPASTRCSRSRNPGCAASSGPLSTATAAGDTIVLNASKSWVTSAGEADSYAWISQPLETPAGAKLWLAPADAAGLAIAAPFDGLGLRSNASSPDTATDVVVQSKARLGDDGGGLDIALPTFQILNTSCSLGLMDAKIAKTIAPATSARFEHRPVVGPPAGEPLRPCGDIPLGRCRACAGRRRGRRADPVDAPTLRCGCFSRRPSPGLRRSRF